MGWTCLTRRSMKLNFESNLPRQSGAIEAACGLFCGQEWIGASSRCVSAANIAADWPALEPGALAFPPTGPTRMPAMSRLSGSLDHPAVA